MKNKILIFLNIIKQINFRDSFDNLKECDILFFCHDVDRSLLLNNRSYSPLIDSIRDNFEGKEYICESISLPWSVLTGSKAHGTPICINRSLIFKKFFNQFLRITRLNIFFNIDSIYDEILKKTKAKLIITIGCSDDLCYRARLNKVFLVELIHGIGYTSIPWGWSNKELKFMPQGILTLDDISYKTFSPLVSKGIEIKKFLIHF